MKKVIFAAAAVLCFSAQAEFKDGNRLYSEMTGSQMNQMAAIGYVTGVADALMDISYCAPNNITAGQIFDMTKQYLEEQPQLRHVSADRIINRVLSRTWPCKNSNRGGQNL